MKYSYSDIEQYLVDYQIDGKRINCTFQTPNGEIYESSSNISASKTIGNAVQNEVARVVKRNARRQTNRLIRSMLGGTAGRIGSRVARSAISNIGTSNEANFTAQDKEEAIVKAFGRVSRHFESNRRERIERDRPERSERRRPERGDRERRGRDRDRGRERRGGRRERSTSDSEYEQIIEEAPVESGYDQEILSRFLVNIASADGKITPDERELLAEVIPSRFGSIQEIQSKDQVSRIEAEEINEGVKETVYLLGWAMALSDFDVDASEVRILNTYGEIFGIPDHRREKLELIAKKYCIEQTITANTSREDIYSLADGIELSRDEAERCLIAFKKKMYE